MARSCSFTGHREIEDRHKGKITALIDRAIAYAYDEGCRDFYLGGALGFDTLAAQEVLRFKLTHPDVTLNFILPCVDQSNMWGGYDVSMYEYLLSRADTVEYTSDTYKKGCMRIRNARLAELCDIMIAYVGRDRSGASQTVGIATRLGKRVYNLYPSLDRE